MKKLKVFGMCAILLCCMLFYSCDWNGKPYKIYWSGDNLYIEMPRPTVGVIGINQIDWGEVKLSDVVADVLKAINEKDRTYGECKLYARLTCNPEDKYGNSTERQDDYLVATMEYAEAKKYQTAQSFNSSYGITYKIEEIVRPTQRNNKPFSISASGGNDVKSPESSKSVEIAVHGKPIETDYHKWICSSIEPRNDRTIITMIVIPKTSGTYMYSTNDEFIEDSDTGERYYLVSSSLGYKDSPTISYDAEPITFYDVYPALPYSVKRINLWSGSQYHVTNLLIR